MGKDHELLEAARTGNHAVVEKLVSTKSKSAALAASIGIRFGVHVNCQDQNGYTPLHHAALNGHKSVVLLLLQAHGSVNVTDNKKSCPLHLAAWNGHYDIVHVLLTSGPDFASINEQNGDKETALHCAAQHGHSETVKILLENHADVTIRNIRDESALDLASQYGRLDVVRLLLNYNPKLLAHSSERFTPLHLASRNGHRGVVELLLVHGADINKVGANGTALHEAALFGKYDVVSLLLKRGAETGTKDASGRSPLELVSQLDTQISRDIAKLIIETDAISTFDTPTNVFTSSPKITRHLSRSFNEADLPREDSRDSPRGRTDSPRLRYSHSSPMTPRSSRSPGTGHRIRGNLLRRTSSARSARSLPRLSSAASFHGNKSVHSLFSHGRKSDVNAPHEVSIHQHHPSIDMFPVTTTPSASGRKGSVSLPSSPQLQSSPTRAPSMAPHGTPAHAEDDVFFPRTPTSGRTAFETFLPQQSSLRSEPKMIPLKPPAPGVSPPDKGNSHDPRPVPNPPTSTASQAATHGKLSVFVTAGGPPPLPKKNTASPPSVQEDLSPPLPAKMQSPFGEKSDAKFGEFNLKTTVTRRASQPDTHQAGIRPRDERMTLPIRGSRDSKAARESNASSSSSTLTPSTSSISELSPGLRSPNAPKKPQRHKLTPPPLPPKPPHMANESKKARPPSPTLPPPPDEEISDAESVASDDKPADGTKVDSLASTPGPKADREAENSGDPKSPTPQAPHDPLPSQASQPTEPLSSPISEIHKGPDIITVKIVPPGTPTLPTVSDSAEDPPHNTTHDVHTAPSSGALAEIPPHKPPPARAIHSALSSGGLVEIPPHKPPPARATVPPSGGVSNSGDAPTELCNSHPSPLSHCDDPEGLNKTADQLSPTLRSPSPPFSPPSPNTAMLQVSSALQKAKPPERTPSFKPITSTKPLLMKVNTTKPKTMQKTEISERNPNEQTGKLGLPADTPPQVNIQRTKTEKRAPVLPPEKSRVYNKPVTGKLSIVQGQALSQGQGSKTETKPQSDKIIEPFKRDVEESSGTPEKTKMSKFEDQRSDNGKKTPVLQPVQKNTETPEKHTTQHQAHDIKSSAASKPTPAHDIKSSAASKPIPAHDFKPSTASKPMPAHDIRSSAASNLTPAEGQQLPTSGKTAVTRSKSGPVSSDQPKAKPVDNVSAITKEAPTTKTTTAPPSSSVTSQLKKPSLMKDSTSTKESSTTKTTPAPMTSSVTPQFKKPSLVKDSTASTSTIEAATTKTTPAPVSPSITSQFKKPSLLKDSTVPTTKTTPAPPSSSVTSQEIPTTKTTPAPIGISVTSHFKRPTLAKDSTTHTKKLTEQASKPKQSLKLKPEIEPSKKPAQKPFAVDGVPRPVKRQLVDPPTNPSPRTIVSKDSRQVPQVNPTQSRPQKLDITGKQSIKPVAAIPKPRPRNINDPNQVKPPGLSKPQDSAQQSSLQPPAVIKPSPVRQKPSPTTEKRHAAMSSDQSKMPSQSGGPGERQKPVLAKKPAQNTQMMSQSDIQFTATEVKRARICSTKSLTEQAMAPVYSDYDNVPYLGKHEDNSNGAIMKTKRSASLGPQRIVASNTNIHIDHQGEQSSQLSGGSTVVGHYLKANLPRRRSHDHPKPQMGVISSETVKHSTFQTGTDHSANQQNVTPGAQGGHVVVKLDEPEVRLRSRSLGPQMGVFSSGIRPVAPPQQDGPHPLRRSTSLMPKMGVNVAKPFTAPGEKRLHSGAGMVCDAYTQTFPPKVVARRKLSQTRKSRSLDVYNDTNDEPPLPLYPDPSPYMGDPFRVYASRSMTAVHMTNKNAPIQILNKSESNLSSKNANKPQPPMKPPLLRNFKSFKKTKDFKIHPQDGRNKQLKTKDLGFTTAGFDSSMSSAGSAREYRGIADVPAISALSLDTSDDWNDALSDRTEDLTFPKEVQKYRGLIRGSSLSYRSRLTSCGAKDAAYESDEFEYDYNVNPKDDYSRVNASLQPEDSLEDVRYATVVTSQSTSVAGGSQTQTRLGEAENDRNRINLMDENRGEIVIKKPLKPTKANAGEPGEKRRREEQTNFARLLLLHNNQAKTSGGIINYALNTPTHSRASSYDNNNNNNSADSTEEKPENRQRGRSSTAPHHLPTKDSDMASAPAIPSPMSDGMPDFGSIVDTVAAVRNKASPHGSTSGVSSSSSSKSSTLAKQPDSVDTGFNENDEWAQIANVMKSVGSSLNKGQVYAQEFEETFWRIMTGSDMPRYVGTWLSDLNLSQYEEVLCGNGFDNINFLASDILEEQDLIDMNIMDDRHRHRMLDSAKNLPKIRTLASFATNDNVADVRKAPKSVTEWLQSLALGDLDQTFKMMGIMNLERVKTMKDTEIAALVNLRGHRKRIRASIGYPNSHPSKTMRSISQPGPKSAGAKLKSSPPLPRSPLLDKVNFFKDYSKTTHSATVKTKTSVASSYGTTSSSSSSAFTNYSSLSDQVVPASISEEPTAEGSERRGKKSSSSKRYHRNLSSPAADSNHRRQSEQHSNTIHTDFRKDDHFVQFSEAFPPQEDDLLTIAISKLTETSSKKSETKSENKENIRMTTESEVRVPDARRASYLSSTGGELVLRPPNETTEEVTVSSWCHDSEVLIKSCCNYQAYYLGSMLVHEVKGVESTVEACSKMKKSTDSMKKIPTVTLSISYRGVKFIDSKTKHEIAEHEIHNISFASQDADDLSTLAYITRDARTGNHYCHVFRVTTLDVAYEIILTLGQAFEVAYQLILKERSLQEGSA